jgi:hypothetical protein
MIALPLITERPIDVLDLSNIHSTAELNAVLAAKYGEDWRDEPTPRDLELEASL